MKISTAARIGAGVAIAGLVSCTIACSSPAGGSSDGTIELTVATFNEFGYEPLFEEYEAAHPGITIKHRKVAVQDEARDNLTTHLAAGSGLADIEAIEVSWLSELLQYSDQFVDLTDPALEGRWLDWKQAAATDEEGRLIGYGTDIGPEAVCYRADLFEAAGLPSDRDSVASFLGDTWDSYFAAGEKFAAVSDVPWFDGADGTFTAMVQQLANPYENADGSLIDPAKNTELRAVFDQLTTASGPKGLSAHLQQWSDDWTAAYQNNGFATILCPGWMLGVISGNAEGVVGWDVANTFPGGGGNWGGSYLTVPQQSEHPKEAQELAAWLTAPEQTIKTFSSIGAFPSQVEALASDEVLGATNEFFNNVPTGEVFGDRAQALGEPPFQGPNYFAVNNAMRQAILRVEQGTQSPDDAWDQWVSDVESLG